eukprot:SAG11_NODE_968_length_6354_cov_16.546922_9_plen_33_part_01
MHLYCIYWYTCAAPSQRAAARGRRHVWHGSART